MESLENGVSLTKQETFTQERLDKISQLYDLGQLSFVSSPESGMITENAILVDENDKKYFAKRYQVEDEERHAATYRASEIIGADKQIPVVMPLLPNDGSFTVSLDGASFALFDYIEHDDGAVEDFEKQKQLVFNTAQALGRIHAVPVDTAEPLLRPIDRWAPEAGQKRIGLLKRIIALIEDKEVRDDFDELSTQEAKFKLNFLERDGEPPVVEIPDVICHADFHDKNIFHDENMEVIAICDWDNSGLANPYMDFLNAFYSNVERPRQYSLEDKSLLGKAFVEGYKAGLGSQIDLEILEATYQSFIQERVGSTFPMYQHYFNNDNKTDHMLAGRSGQIRKLVENPGGMLDLIQTAVELSV